jgi:hypothetical protein
LPELSVDAFQASEMVVSVVAVIRRFVGVVGGVRSRRAAPAVLAPKATMSRIAPTASPVFRKDIGSSLPRGRVSAPATDTVERRVRIGRRRSAHDLGALPVENLAGEA